MKKEARKEGRKDGWSVGTHLYPSFLPSGTKVGLTGPKGPLPCSQSIKPLKNWQGKVTTDLGRLVVTNLCNPAFFTKINGHFSLLNQEHSLVCFLLRHIYTSKNMSWRWNLSQKIWITDNFHSFFKRIISTFFLNHSRNHWVLSKYASDLGIGCFPFQKM